MRPTSPTGPAGPGEGATMAEHHRMFVDGEWIEAADGGAFAVSDPATGEVIAPPCSSTRATTCGSARRRS